MIDDSQPPKKWFECAYDVIQAAKNHLSLDDYKQQSKLNTYGIGYSYLYRIDVLNRLLREGIVIVSESRLRIGLVNNLSWLDNALERGSKNAWKLVDETLGPTDEQLLFDSLALKRIGDNGERYVIDQLYNQLHSSLYDQVQHVALTNDLAGFDIFTPSVLDSMNHYKLEVKTSTRYFKDRFEFYLSRNEYEVGRKNRNWCIVCVGQYDSELVILGHIYSYQIESRLPRDSDEYTRWVSSKVRVEKTLLREGLP